MSGWVAYHKLSRQQLLTLAIALEEQRDRALGKLADAWDEGKQAGKLFPARHDNPYRSGQ